MDRPHRRMARHLAFLTAVVAPTFVWGYSRRVDGPGPIGVWEASGGGRAFRYDGRYVTEELAPRWSWEWSSGDNYWRLEARWAGNDLMSRGPYGNWGPVATFAGGRFRDRVGREYRKVGPLEAVWKHPAVLRWRLPYDYSLDPSERGRSGQAAWLAWARDRIDLVVGAASLAGMAAVAVLLWRARCRVHRATRGGEGGVKKR